LIGNASATNLQGKPVKLIRGVFDKKVRRKPLTFAADAVILATGNYEY
jgi:aspartate oxidase